MPRPPASTSEARLLAMPYSSTKRLQRAAMLAERPELRRRIDTAPLRKLIGYIAFKCHPSCSIARDQAIAGSDIDGGLVITQPPTSDNAQLTFVAELRRQGFTACHPQEFEYARQQYEQAVGSGLSVIDPIHGHLVKRLTVAEFSRIHFVTKEDAAVLPPESIGNIYRAGFSIE